MLKHLDLFSGIGGFALAARWTGQIETVAFCEIEPYCQKVLAKNFPGVYIHDDIRTLTTGTLEARGIGPVDMLTGGFPCQDISVSSLRSAGIQGERSGLWFEMLRLIRESRPRWAVIENSPHLRTKGADEVLGGLERAGYACWPLVVGAWAAGAPHSRDRVFIVAMENATAGERITGAEVEGVLRTLPTDGAEHDNPDRSGEAPAWDEPLDPRVLRVADGIPYRVDRVGGCGNAVVPQVVYPILQEICALHNAGY